MTDRKFAKKLGTIAAIILISGMIRYPFEVGLVKQLQEDGFHPKHRQEDVTLTEQIGVQSFIGILGGLRYMVATFIELEAWSHWEYNEWDQLSNSYQLVNLLQPRDSESWMTGAWHHIYNASAWYEYDDKEHPAELRKLFAREYIEHGKKMLKKGIEWNPNNYWLWRDLGRAYKEKDEDYCNAADAYLAASKIENAPQIFFRFYGYYAAKCPGREQEAYDALWSVYTEGKMVLERQGKMIWKPTLIITLKELEEKLNIPEERCIPELFDEEEFQIISPIRAYQLLRSPGKQQEAYEMLRSVYEDGKRILETQGKMIWTPKLIQTLKLLEQSLNIPEANRIPESVDELNFRIITPIRP